MHERSLVRSLLNQVEVLRIQHDATAVEAVTVELGPLSGVEVELIEDAFGELASRVFQPVPVLNVARVGLAIECSTCGKQSVYDIIRFDCVGCGSNQVRVISGDEFRLVDVDLTVVCESGVAS